MKVCQCRKSAVRIDPQAILFKLSKDENFKDDPRFIEEKKAVEFELRQEGKWKTEEEMMELFEYIKIRQEEIK